MLFSQKRVINKLTRIVKSYPHSDETFCGKIMIKEADILSVQDFGFTSTFPR